MSELQIFNHQEFGEVRTVMVDGAVHFVGIDVGRALEYARPSEAVTAHCKGTVTCRILSQGGEQDTNVIPIGDVLRLITQAAKQSRNLAIREKARRYESWIFDEVLPTIHQTGSYSMKPAVDDLESKRITAQADRAQAMLLNAKTRAFKELSKSINDKNLSPIAKEVFGIRAVGEVMGIDAGTLLPEHERTYSATEIGMMCGVSANKVGKVANANGLKIPEYGIEVLDKSRYSAKEVSAFRYNSKGVETIKRILGAG